MTAPQGPLTAQDLVESRLFELSAPVKRGPQEMANFLNRILSERGKRDTALTVEEIARVIDSWNNEDRFLTKSERQSLAEALVAAQRSKQDATPKEGDLT